MKDLLQEKWQAGINYEAYRTMIDELLVENKTTGTNHSEAMIHYTKLNVQRMKRLDKTVQLEEALKAAIAAIDQPMRWLVLTEAWCGDAAQNIPVLAHIAVASKYIDLKFILRDEHPDCMDQFLTNGGRSIPKLICLNEEGTVIGTWGPRPEPAQKMTMDYKANPIVDYQEFVVEVQKWYAKDRTKTVQQEFINLLEQWK